ncbi:ribonuclease D [Pseudohalioglobus sediminis]|uniref:Ribonuclease D n=1 Tax=Pseudohalioglobus sediminis TaxID=2606449 RepID=A0A5B0X431_9GAMM|nr:ribonuclease D [Pseudohalioglobus sediminis]KAA1193485.1 ribonuclease D [Pseudohalioglobus sediminis]
MDWQLVENDSALAELLARAKGCSAVMVDTEFMRRSTFYPQVALVQLCFAEGDAANCAWLIDPLAIEDPAPLAELLTDVKVVKVLHSASEDLEVFQRWLGVLPVPLFDTQKAAALVGLDFGLGYRALVHQLCGEDLPKGETRSDWLQRPLTESQCHYAAQDVIWLLDVYRQLDRRLREQGRRAWVLEDGEAACTALATTSDGYYKRIKSAWKLQPQQLAILISLCDWRDDMARRKDKPRSWILDDKACLQLAQRAPANMAEMRSQVELHPATLRRYGEDLLDVLAEAAQAADHGELERLPAPLTAAQRNAVKKLKQHTERIASDLGVAPQALVSGKDFERLVRGTGPIPASWSGWRKQAVIEHLQATLEEGQA